MRFDNKNVILPEPIIDYLCFTAKASNSTVKITLVGTPTYSADFEYSLDGKNWITYSIGNTITLPNINDKVYMRGDTIATAESSNIRKQLNTTGNLKLSGDLRSLLSKNNFSTLDILPDNAFFNFMRDCTAITDAHELKLSATSIGGGAYCNLFKNCTNLVYGPASIDATIFTGPDACSQMFLGCTSLVETPILKGKILNNGSYFSLCDGCTSLRKVTAYCTNISASLSTHYWLRNVAATGDFYNLGGATYQTGASGIPPGWTVHTSL